MGEETRVRWNEVYRKKGFEVGVDKDEYIVAVSDEKAYALTPIVYFIWSHCDGETTIGHIVEDIVNSVEDVDLDTVYNAVIDIVDRLVEAELLEKV